jgi:hypothetical protein
VSYTDIEEVGLIHIAHTLTTELHRPIRGALPKSPFMIIEVGLIGMCHIEEVGLNKV